MKTIEEGYDKINGKYVKDNDKYRHYTSLDAFYKIVSSGFLKGFYYPANTYTFGKKANETPNDKKKELCVVRSDRSPDASEVVLSGNIGDIKFILDEDKIRSRFKIKPIQEFPVQQEKFVRQDIEDCKNYTTSLGYPPFVDNKLKSILKANGNMTDAELDAIRQKLKFYIKEPILGRIISSAKRWYKMTHKGTEGEKMEERIQVGNKQGVPLTMVKKVLIPDYLKGLNLSQEIIKLRNYGCKVEYYHCKNPKDEAFEKYGKEEQK